MSSSNPKLSTLALHTGPPSSAWEGGAERHLAPPITPSATFVLPRGEEVIGEPVYGRYGNPSRLQLEATLAALEGADHCLTFASGMAAICAVLDTLVPGEQVVASNQLYGGSLAQIQALPKRGVEVAFVDACKEGEVMKAVTSATKLVWLEVCTNPGLRLLDLKKVVNDVRSLNQGNEIIIGIDNTFLTPWVVRPLTFGVDLVMHSCTKYLNGHSDVIMGSLLMNSERLHSRLAAVQRYHGAVPSPFDCYLVLRSLATLDVRMRRHETTGLRVAEWLEQQEGVHHHHHHQHHHHRHHHRHRLELQEGVHGVTHPLLPSHSQHKLALAQHGGRHSGMLAFSLGSGNQAAVFLSSLQLIKSAASLGSTHSLACQPARITHAMCNKKQLEEAGVTKGMLRISLGLEEAEDIISDLDQALQRAVLQK